MDANAIETHMDAVVRHYESEIDTLLSSLKECALQIAQIHDRKLTADEQIALDNARDVISRVGASRS